MPSEQEFRTFLTLASIPLRQLRDGFPLGISSGCLVQYGGRHWLLTVAHSTGNMGDWAIEVGYENGRGTKLYRLGPMNFVARGNLSNDMVTDLDMAYVQVPVDLQPRWQPTNEHGEIAQDEPRVDVTQHSVPLNEITGGGPPRDGIPALDAPKFISAEQARKFLSDKDRVLGVAMAGTAKAYPIRILNWHEIVNDEINGHPITVTWCPLCVSGVVYDPLINGKRFTFGVSGKLYKSALVLYDRQTDSLWSQILQQSITGPMTETKLTMLPAQHTTWKEWQDRHPETLVLSPDTGFKRDYVLNPYQQYYERGELVGGPNERAKKLDPDLRPTERVLGIQLSDVKKAYPFSRLKRQHGDFKDTVAGQDIVIHFDPKPENAYTTALSGEQIPSIVIFWSAWVDFYPATEVFRPEKVQQHK